MAKKNKRKSNVKSSLLVLLLILILLMSTTYAWFTANKNVSINELDIKVEAANGLQISSDAENWKTLVTNEDLIAGYTGGLEDTNQIPISAAKSVVPVSTAGEIVEGKMKMFQGTLGAKKGSDKFALTATPSVETKGQAGDFIAFDVFMKVTEKTQLYLSATSSVKGGEANNKLQRAARVAIINLGHAPDASGASTYHALNTAVGTAFIWEPNADKHKPEAIENARTVLGMNGSTGPKTPIDGTEQDTTIGVKAAIGAEQSIEADKTQLVGNNGTYFQEVTSNLKSKEGEGGEGLAGAETLLPDLNLEAGVTKVRIYMWVEGQDIDCENTASNSNVKYNLQFNIK